MNLIHKWGTKTTCVLPEWGTYSARVLLKWGTKTTLGDYPPHDEEAVLLTI